MSEVIKNRYDFVAFFDVENGNPNGDPDAGNMPRIDPETGCGIVTDVCLKRKIRNYVETIKDGVEGYDIYIKENVPLNRSDLRAGQLAGCEQELIDIQKSSTKDAKRIGQELKKATPDIDRILRDKMCETFFDVRTFGAVMTTFVKGALNCGQVRGPVQFTFARSIDPVFARELTITRVAITKEDDALNKETEMGSKHIIPYGLYRMEGYVSANLARKTTGFNEDDLALLWDGILNMFEHDRSAARGKMSNRGLFIFKHASELGNAPAHELFDRIDAKRIDEDKPARKFSDYEISIDDKPLPDGVELIRF